MKDFEILLICLLILIIVVLIVLLYNPDLDNSRGSYWIRNRTSFFVDFDSTSSDRSDWDNSDNDSGDGED